MTRIVSIGECMVELAPSSIEGSFQIGFAGDTMNTAWYLRQLLGEDHQVDYLSAVGQDAISDQMLGFLEDAGIGTDPILRLPGLTVGLYMIQLQDGERSFSYWRGQSAARHLASDTTHIGRALNGAQIAFFSGITLAILSEADRKKLLETLSSFRGGGGTVVFDPNLRPRLWETPDIMTASIMAAARVSNTVLPSHEDEATWFGDADPEATMARYIEAGAQTVVVKNGPGEILISDNGTISRVSPVAASKVVDTTAAGDSFNAGFLAAQLAGKPIKQAVAEGAALAGRVIQSRGALMPCAE
ncbi:sugar kinase [Sedimentitalea todarodis]|uniref:Sugar kinase n=1 Tax=Sedimentitalea todarodis TaxID=1631240 RepID=A0ABU3VJB1_9RHOB|nr:sugar kinase [Sedimentitalea todarodis]MDU9006282.1 sugar kinase [Sedimentitalea todarodis]